MIGPAGIVAVTVAGMLVPIAPLDRAGRGRVLNVRVVDTSATEVEIVDGSIALQSRELMHATLSGSTRRRRRREQIVLVMIPFG